MEYWFTDMHVSDVMDMTGEQDFAMYLFIYWSYGIDFVTIVHRCCVYDCVHCTLLHLPYFFYTATFPWSEVTSRV